MDKQQLLDELRAQVTSGAVSRDEVNQVFGMQAAEGVTDSSDGLHRHLSLQQVIYYIGGAIVFLGLSFMISQNWDSFNTVARILITLGAGIVTYVMAFLFSKSEDTKSLAQPFFLLSALLVPMGIGVVLYEAEWSRSGYLALVVISGLSLALFASSLVYFKSNLHLLFTVIFSSWLFMAVTSWLVEYDARTYFFETDFWMYRFLVIGVSYMLLGYYTANTKYSPMTGPLYFFGSFAVLLSTIILGGWTPTQNVFWELVYPLLSLGIVFWSTQIKSRSLLLWGTVFFMSYLVKISSEYFADTLGWSAALIISGLCMIAVGYFAFRIKKQYIS